MLLLGLAATLLGAPQSGNPSVIALGAGRTISRLDPGRDYVLKCPPTLKVGATIILGGHDITLRGCDIAIPAVTPPGDANQRAVYIKGATGTVLIEGVHVSNPFGAQFDAFYVAAPEADVVLRNNRIDGLIGRHAQFHSDAVQTEGTRTLRVSYLTIVGGYQMLSLPSPAGKPATGEIWVDHVNGRFVGHQIWGNEDSTRGDNGGTFIWLVRGLSCTPAAGRIHLDEVYAKLFPERGPGGAGRPNDRDRGCPAKVARDRVSVTWPSLPVDGKVILGEPARGDFVPAGMAGVNYRPPR